MTSSPIEVSRQQLAVDVAAIAGDSWDVVTGSSPDIFHRTIQVGHPVTFIPETFASFVMVIPVTFWIDEYTDAEAIDAMYAVWNPAPGGIYYSLLSPPDATPYRTIEFGNVGPRRWREGATIFLAADTLISVRVLSTMESP